MQLSKMSATGAITELIAVSQSTAGLVDRCPSDATALAKNAELADAMANTVD
jgi:hypothetical protein